MNSKQSNKLASYAAVEAALQANPEIESVPGLPAKLAMLSARMGEIKSLANTQTQPIQAGTARRDQLLEEMTGTTLEIAGFITSIAREQNLPDLLRTVDVGPGFRRARRAHRLVLAQRVFEAAQTVLPHFGSYGVGAETLAAFQAQIVAADKGLTIPRSTIVAKKGATVKLAGLFDEVDVLLKDHIDRLVFPLRKARVEFYASYLAARSVVDRPGGRGAPKEAPTTPASVPATASTPATPPAAEGKLAA